MQGAEKPAVALRKESVDRNTLAENPMISVNVALRKESVDRNKSLNSAGYPANSVALRKESVDRNKKMFDQIMQGDPSLSARRAWIEIS